jgi:hypothetical protein
LQVLLLVPPISELMPAPAPTTLPVCVNRISRNAAPVFAVEAFTEFRSMCGWSAKPVGPAPIPVETLMFHTPRAPENVTAPAPAVRSPKPSSFTVAVPVTVVPSAAYDVSFRLSAASAWVVENAIRPPTRATSARLFVINRFMSNPFLRIVSLAGRISPPLDPAWRAFSLC